MKFMNFLLAVIALTSISHVALADDLPNSDAAGAGTEKTPITSPERGDIDDEITNARLRASTGAKRLWSVQSTLNYNGGPITDPLSQTRPLLSTGALAAQTSILSGTIAGKYRLTDHDNLNVGFGIGWVTPLYKGERGEAENPYVAYSRTFKTGTIQNVFVAQLTGYTDAYTQSIDDAANIDINHTFLTNVGKSKLQLGLNFDFEREFYKQTVISNLYEIAVYPFAEYEFTDKLSFRTVYRGLTYDNHTNALATWIREEPTQSLGIGISVTRDIYLYPNIQWVWAAMEAKRTNVALAANINL